MPENGSDTKEKVLVVDDEADIVVLCRANLEYEGFTVLEARDGREALEMVKREHPDAIVLDIMMPRLSGWEVLTAIRADPSTADLPIVLLTGKVGDEDQIRGWSSGASDYIAKPFNPMGLARAVKAALQRTQPEFAEQRRRRILDSLQLKSRFTIEER